MGKTYKKGYTGSKKVDRSCRCNGGCEYCHDNRTIRTRKQKQRSKDILDEYYNGQDED